MTTAASVQPRRRPSPAASMRSGDRSGLWRRLGPGSTPAARLVQSDASGARLVVRGLEPGSLGSITTRCGFCGPLKIG